MFKWLSFCSWVVLNLGVVFALDSQLTILQTELTHKFEDFYFLNVVSDIRMSDEQMEILNSGISLTFVYEIKINEVVFASVNKNKVDHVIPLQLRYHNLSKQYVVRNLTSKTQESFPTLTLALSQIANINDIPIRFRQRKLIKYQGNIKLWLDIEALPPPLRIPAYLSKKWRLNSGWKRWELPIYE